MHFNSYQEYILYLLNQELVLAQQRQNPGQKRKSGYIRGIERSIEIIKANM